nr:MAG TPA: hypothetical protein [Caudoviricetes sp.]
MESLAEQFEKRIFKPFNAYAVEKAKQVVDAIAIEAVDIAIAKHNPFSDNDFYDITGNLFTSISAAAYYKGVPFALYSVGDTEKAPLSKTLTKGMKKYRPFYAEPFAFLNGGPYTAPSGEKRVDGPTESRKALTDMFNDIPKSHTWAVRVIAAVPHAFKAHNLMVAIKDEVAKRASSKKIW